MQLGSGAVCGRGNAIGVGVEMQLGSGAVCGRTFNFKYLHSTIYV